jgi:hypothetical protein
MKTVDVVVVSNLILSPGITSSPWIDHVGLGLGFQIN